MRTIYISVGHDTIMKGAYCSFIDEFEYDICKEYSKYLQKELEDLNLDVILVKNDKLQNAVSEINQTASKNDIAIETHFNSFPEPTVNGCETLYYEDSKRGEKLAQHVQNANLAYFSLRDRGLVGRDNLYFLKHTKCTAIIPEPFFLSNEEEVGRFLIGDREAKLRSLAYATAIGIKAFVNEEKRNESNI